MDEQPSFDHGYLCLEYMIRCKHPGCYQRMYPPARTVPFRYNGERGDAFRAEIDKRLSHWPPGDWSAAIGCPECGNILRYVADDVDWNEVEQEAGNIYIAGDDCYSVSCECAKSDCRVPVLFHAIEGDVEGQELTETSLLDKLHAGFYVGKCSAGHSLLPIPRNRYRLNRVLGAIPTDGE